MDKEPEAIADWWLQSACAEADPELFFPERGQSTDPAKAICYTCPVRSECLRTALENHERHGIWGGLSERQRRFLRKEPQFVLKRIGHGSRLVAAAGCHCVSCDELAPQLRKDAAVPQLRGRNGRPRRDAAS